MFKKIIWGIIIVTTMVALIAFAVPGSEDDPLISMNYLNTRLEALKLELSGETTPITDEDIQAQIDKKIATLDIDSKIEAKIKGLELSEQAPPSLKFEALTFPAGTHIEFGDSTEFIVRLGKTSVVDPLGNTIPDLTTGTAIRRDESVPLDHHMLNPVQDGRGLIVEKGDQFWIMIKGSYKVIQ